MSQLLKKASGPTKRERLVAAARDEIHRRGYAATTLARIAQAAEVPLGNVYYYFKTKDELVHAVVDEHLGATEQMIESASQEATPLARLERFVALIEEQSEEVARNGCPVGCLSQELEKTEGPFEGCSEKIFSRKLGWLEEQFREAGKGEEARDLAVHFLSCAQGASVVCQSLGDPEVLKRELGRLRGWLRGIL